MLKLRKSGGSGGGPARILRLFFTLIFFSILGLGIYYFNTNPEANNLLHRVDVGPLSTKINILALSVGIRLPEKIECPQQISKKVDEMAGVKTVENQPQNSQTKTVIAKFGIVADSHSENEKLAKALRMIREENISYVIGLGDYTQVGTVAELEEAQNVFANSGLNYYVVPGDHDLWDSRDKDKKPTANFEAVFGKNYQAFVLDGTRFLLMDNTDNYSGVSREQMDWVKQQLEIWAGEKSGMPTFVFLHEPLYYPESEHTMGRVNEELKKQAKSLLQLFSQTKISEVFSGDIHFFTRFTDPATNVKITTVGATAGARNLQMPRFAIISVYDDGSWLVEDREIQ